MAITGLGNGVGVCIDAQNASNCRSIDLCREADAPAFYGRGVHELADRGEHRGDGLVVVPVFAFKLIELLGKRFVRRQQFAQPYERAHHMHTHLNRSGAVQDIGRLYGAVLGEGKWWESRISMLGGSGRNLRPVENLNFDSREPKYEIRGKSSGIPFDGLVQAFGRYAIESSEISIEDDALAA
jgi:hypothetical protein